MTQYTEDIEFAGRVLRGDPQAMSRLVNHYCAPTVQHFVNGNTRRCGDCLDEVTQAVCTEIFRGGDWRPIHTWLAIPAKRASLRTYLKTVVLRTALRHCRSCRREFPRLAHHPADSLAEARSNDLEPLQASLGVESRSALLSAIGRLESAGQRAVLLGLYFRGQSIGQMAQLLGASENHVSQMKSRGLAQLREALDPNAAPRPT